MGKAFGSRSPESTRVISWLSVKRDSIVGVIRGSIVSCSSTSNSLFLSSDERAGLDKQAAFYFKQANHAAEPAVCKGLLPAAISTGPQTKKNSLQRFS